MDSDFARQYYESASADHWWFRGRAELVSALLRRFEVNGGRFVDLGAGPESLLPSHLSVVKLDVVRPEEVEGRFVEGSAEQLPFPDGVFDGVGLFDVLEHLDEPPTCLKEAGRVLKARGILLVTVPAYQWLWSPHDDLVAHKRRYTPSLLRSTLNDAGFEVAWLSAFYGFLLVPAVARKVLSLHSPMDMPSAAVNRTLGLLAVRSASRALDRPRRGGLSIAAAAFVPG